MNTEKSRFLISLFFFVLILMTLIRATKNQFGLLSVNKFFVKADTLSVTCSLILRPTVKLVLPATWAKQPPAFNGHYNVSPIINSYIINLY